VALEGTLEGDLAGAGDLKSFLALELVLTFGILNAFCMIPCWRIHTGGSLMGPFGLLFRLVIGPKNGAQR